LGIREKEKMKLIKDETSAWETHLVEGYPFGIEKIDRGAWYPFQLWGKRRIYLDTKGMSKEKATAILKERLEDYKSRIVEGVTA
jgi:hypothetical protein